MDALPPGVDSILTLIIKEATALFRLYRSREGERKTFALFMSNVARTLQGVQGSVPEHAEPVALELAALVTTATSKCTKYAARGRASSVLHLRSETEKMQRIMQDVQQLLPLLTVSVASAADVSAALTDLQGRAASLQDSSADAAAHMRHMHAAVEALAASNATAVQVEQCMAALHASMMQMNEGSVSRVLEGCAALHVQLGQGLDSLLEAVDMIQLTVDSFSKQMLALQKDISEDVKEMKGYLAAFCGMGGNAAQSMQPGRILAAIDEVIEANDSDGGALPDTNEKWAAAIRDAILGGKLSITSCLVLSVPLMPEGPLRPVTLPCCGFVVSHAGAQQVMERGRCQVCNCPIAAGAELHESDSVAAAVAAESHGFAPRIVRSEDVTLGSKIGSGGEATVVKGTFRGRAVAVKKIPVSAAAGVKEVASVKHVVSTSYIAGVASPYVCQLHGYCWTDAELWLLLELCDGTLTDLVPRAKQQCGLPGLPPVDTVALGLMLCSALGAVHRSARCLHLDLTPGNVLLATFRSGGSPQDSGGAGERGVRLSDFGLSKHLPTCVRSTLATGNTETLVQGVAKGTPGYAPKEQLMGHGQRRSDIYSLGATLLYAATGVHPYGGDTLQAIMLKLMTGTPMQVPEYVEPPALRELLSAMTAVEVSARPALASVQQRLLSVHSALLAEGAVNHFITPANKAADSRAPSNAAETGGLSGEQTSGNKIKSSSSAPVTEPLEAGLRSLALKAAPESDHRPAAHSDQAKPEGSGRCMGAPPPNTAAAAAAPSVSAPGLVAHVSPDGKQHAAVERLLGGGSIEAVSGVDSIRTVEDLLANLSTGIAGRTLDFRGRTLPLASTQQAAADQYVSNRLHPGAQLCHGGGVAANVTLALGAAPENMLLLRSTSRVEFQATTIQGGQLHCEGPECKVTLRNAVLENCQLAVTAGATVDIHCTQVLPLQLSSVRYLCGMWGRGTTVYANNTVFHGDVRAYGGAAFTGDEVQVRVGNGDTVGAVAMGEGSRVTLRGCDVAHSPGAGPGQRVGVCARDSAVADLTNCSLRQVYLGVQVASGGCACLRDCKVEAEGDGVWLEGAGSRVQAVGCRVGGRGAALAIAESVVAGNVSFDEQCELGRTRTIVHDGASGQHQTGGRTTPEEVSQQAHRTGAGGRQKWADWLRR